MSAPDRLLLCTLLLVVAGCHDGNKIIPSPRGSGAGADADRSGAPVFGADAAARDAAAPRADADVGPEPSCAADSFKARRLPLDLLVLLDRSGSMDDPVTPTKHKWQMAQEALLAFIADPGSAGLGVGLQLFPADKLCQSDADCGLRLPVPLPDFACREPRACAPISGQLPVGCQFPGDPICGTGACQTLGRCSLSGAFCIGLGSPCGAAGDVCASAGKSCQLSLAPESCAAADYAAPLVPFADLPGNAPALLAALGRSQPGGQTPTLPAVQGALDHLRARLTALPDRRVALVLVTDGLPTSCGSTVAGVTALVGGAHAATPAIDTYAIGVFGANDAADGQAALTEWARQGGGGAPFVLSPTADLTGQLLAALNQIRGAALPCAYAIPTPTMGKVDFKKVNLHYQPSAGGAGEDILYVGAADRCDAARGGWYYDVAPEVGTPTQVRVCDATCRRLKADATAQVALRLGCQTRVIE